MSTLETDLSVSPYFDDFSEDKNFHRVLNRPGVPVQTRELNQLQTILQNQIERFGKNIFKEGTIIRGCSFSFDTRLKYAKVVDLREDGQPLAITSHDAGSYVVNSNNLIGEVVSTATGLESQSPNLNTFFFHYLNSGTNGETSYTNSEVLTIYASTTTVNSISIDSAGTGYAVDDGIVFTTIEGSAAVANVSSVGGSGEITGVTVSNGGTGYTIRNVPVLSVTTSGGSGAQLSCVLNNAGQVRIANSSFSDAVGLSHSTSVTDGIVFQKGHFIRVDKQTVVTSKYYNTPDNISVGFVTDEALVNTSIDTTLLDNAAGFANENAPGADRLKLTPTLTVRNTINADVANNFFTLIRFEGGLPVLTNQRPQFDSVADSMALRTSEESGDYVIRNIALNTETIAANTSHRNVVTGAGVAYIDGHRVELNAPRRTAIPVANTFAATTSSALSQNYGNYVEVNEFYGDFQFNEGDTVLLYDLPFNTLTDGTDESATPRMPSLNTGTLALDRSSPDAVAATCIGHARIRNVVHSTGVQGTPGAVYRIYLFGVKMFSGHQSKNIRSMFHYSGALTGYDTNGSYEGVCDINLNADGEFELQENHYKQMVFPWGSSALKRMRTGASSNTVFRFRTAITTTEFDEATGNASFTISGTGNSSPYGDGYVGEVLENDFIVIPRESANGSSVNSAASFTVTDASGIITGSGFVTSAVGDYVTFTDGGNTSVKRIVSINSPTEILVDPPVDTSAGDAVGSIAGASFLYHFPAYVPIHLDGRSSANVNITSSGTTVYVDLGHPTLSNNVDCSIYYDIQRSTAEHLRKDLEEIYVQIDIDGGANTTGPFCLGVPDVYDISNVYVNDGSYTEAVGDDATSSFRLDKRQKDSHYGLSFLEILPGQTPFNGMSTPKLVAKVRVFRQSTSGGGFGFFNVESYPVDDVDAASNNELIYTQNIPVFTSPSNGRTFDLRDCVDFRPYSSNTVDYAATLGAASTLTPGTVAEELDTFSGELYAPAVNESMSADIEYYLPRIDKMSLTSDGKLALITGQPDAAPVPPPDHSGAMSLGTIFVPPYPSLDARTGVTDRRPEYAIRVSQSQTRAFTMKDISQMSERLSRLEYYTSLNLLERSASDLLIPGEANTSLNRFKNGILVDNFRTLAVADDSSEEFLIGHDPARQMIVPRFSQTYMPFQIDNLTNTKGTGDLVTLDYENELILSNRRGTKSRVVAGAFWKYYGDISMTPDYDNVFSVTTNPTPAINIDVDLTAPTLALVDNLNEIVPMLSTTTTVVVESSVITDTSNDPSGSDGFSGTSVDTDGLVRTVTATDTITHQNQLAVTGSTLTFENVGDYVSNISFVPFIRGQQIHMHVTGLRPNMVHHVYFDDVDVDTYVTPAVVNLENTIQPSSFQPIGARGTALSTNERGEAFFILDVPEGTFYVGDRKVVVMNESSISGLNGALSVAIGFFRAFNFSMERTGITVSTRQPSISRTTTTSQAVEGTSSIHHATETEASANAVTEVITDPQSNVAPNANTTQNTAPVTIITDIDTVDGGSSPAAPTQQPTPEPSANNPAPTTPSVPTTNSSSFTEDTDTFDEYTYNDIDIGSGAYGDDNGGFTGTDPIAQTFLIRRSSASAIQEGMFATMIDLFFEKKDTTTGITLELREVVNGFPSSRVVPFSRVHLRPEDVSVSADASASTRFTFPSPVFLRSGREYAFVLLPDGNSPNYSVFVSRIGDADLQTEAVSNSDWGAGVMFLSTNNSTWDPVMDEDVKFNLYIARHQYTTGTVKVTNRPMEFLSVNAVSGTFSESEWVTQDGANSAGTLTFTSANTEISGSGTDFTLLSVGEKVTLVSNTGTVFDVVEVTSITDATTMNIKGYPTFSDNAGKYRESPVGIITQTTSNTIVLDQSTAETGSVFAAASEIFGVRSGANAVIQSVDNKAISNFEPLVSRLDLQNTGMSFKLRACEIGVGYGLTAETEYRLNDKNHTMANVHILSRTNEIANLSGAKSVEGYFYFTSSSRKVSPVLDMQNVGLLTYENIVNNDTTDEHLPNQGNSLSKYVSKTVILDEGLNAEDLRVYVTGYQPLGTTIDVYARLHDDVDETRFIDRHWTKLARMSQEGEKSSSDDPFDFREYVYEIPREPSVNAASHVGSVAVTSATNVVTGTGTEFNTGSAAGEFVAGDLMKIEGASANDFFVGVVASVTNDTEVILAEDAPFTGTGLVYYRIANTALQQAFKDPNGSPAHVSTYFSADQEKFTTFKNFSIKIVLSAQNKYLVPKVKDFRALALSV